MNTPNRTISQADPIDVEIGARVRFYRSLVGISQSELGDAVGVTFQQIQKYERGANRISGSAMVRIAKCLKITPAMLFGDTARDGETGDVIAALVATPDAVELLTAFAEVSSPKLRRAVIDLVRGMG